MVSITPSTLKRVHSSTETLAGSDTESSLFSASLDQTDAVKTIETAYTKYKDIQHAKGSALLLNLLKTHGTVVTSLDQLAQNDKFVVHRKTFENRHKESHGLLATVYDILGDDYVLTIHEVLAHPRNPNSYHEYARMDAPKYPGMAIHKSDSMYNKEHIQTLIGMGVIYKVNITHEQLENAITKVVEERMTPRGKVFYGKTFDCNVFLYDVLRRVYK